MDSENTKSLLLVEDEAIIALTNKMAIEKYGYSVTLASSGEEAVNISLNNEGIDLILMDINLGNGIDGTEAAEIILNEKEIPVVFLSSHTDKETVEKTEKITSYGYVVKNSNMTVLDASIKMAFKLFEANRKLHENGILQQTVLDSLDEAMYLIDSDFQIMLYNKRLRKWCEELGFTTDLTGHKNHEVFPFLSKPDLDQYKKVFEKGDSIITQQETSFQDRTVISETRKIPLKYKNKVTGVMTIVNDITERKSIENEMHRHAVEQNILLDVSRNILSTRDLEQVLQIISDGASELLNIETSAIYLIEESELFLGATTPPLDPEMPDYLRRADLKDHPHISKAVKEGIPVIIADANEEELSPSEKEIVAARGLRSLIYCPFVQEHNALGVLILGTKGKTHNFTRKEIDLCQTISNQVTMGIQNAQLHAGLTRYANELKFQLGLHENLRREPDGSETEYSSSYKDSPLPHFLMDSNKQLTEINPAMCRLTDYSREELVKKSFGDLLTPESSALFDEWIQKHRNEGKVYKLPLTITGKKGQEISVFLTGNFNFSDPDQGGDILFALIT